MLRNRIYFINKKSINEKMNKIKTYKTKKKQDWMYY